MSSIDVNSFNPSEKTPVGRFAPTPSGKLHIGNAFSFLIAFLVVKQQGGSMRMRVEDLDKDRCKPELVELLFRDFEWLGFSWEGEVVYQSKRDDYYQTCFNTLDNLQLIYPCYCSRADLHAASAPHIGERVVYPGTCRFLSEEERRIKACRKNPSYRVMVKDAHYQFYDLFQGRYESNLAQEWGDFIVRRSDGVFAYQLAVVCDDSAMGITSVVRGCDLLSSTPCQMYLDDLLGYRIPQFGHVPLFVDKEGRRLAKRSGDISIEALREKRGLSPRDFWGILAYESGLVSDKQPCSLDELCKEANLNALRGLKSLELPSFISR